MPATPLPKETDFDWSKPVHMPFETFLDFIEHAEAKYEYDENGRVIPLSKLIMDSGGSWEHSSIKVNLVGELRDKTRGTGCRVADSDMAVKRRELRTYRFPDASIVCDNPELDPNVSNRRALNNPLAVFEVLSKTTSERDRTDKLEEYGDFDSIRTYVLIESLRVGVQVLDRSEGGRWTIDYVTDRDGTITIPSINIELSLAELYRDVELQGDDRL